MRSYHLQPKQKAVAVKDEPLSPKVKSEPIKSEPEPSPKAAKSKTRAKKADGEKRVIVKKEYDKPGQTKETPPEVSHAFDQLSLRFSLFPHVQYLLFCKESTASLLTSCLCVVKKSSTFHPLTTTSCQLCKLLHGAVMHAHSFSTPSRLCELTKLV